MQLFENSLCIKCRGRGFCKKPCRIYSKIKDFIPKKKIHFSGDSPPEIFVGRYNYPEINAGILSPDSNEGINEEDKKILSFPELWHKKNLNIDAILTNRSKLIYGKFKTRIKEPNNRFLKLMQEISMADKSVSTEFFLKNPPKQTLEINKNLPIIGNPASLLYARLQENPKIKPKVEHIVSDINAKSKTGIIELYNSNIEISTINKVLSAGLLGLKLNRKLVPTKWSITAVDDLISKTLLKNIRYYPEISDIMLFNSNYNGNHYEIILLPEKYSFEVIELEISGSLWNQTGKVSVMKDYERFMDRKYYAINVTGAYYANRLALTEFLTKIKKQATAIFFREVGPEYYAPLGVGILREITRNAFSKSPEKFNSIKDALSCAQKRLRVPIENWVNESVLLKEAGKQKRLSQWI